MFFLMRVKLFSILTNELFLAAIADLRLDKAEGITRENPEEKKEALKISIFSLID